MPEINTLFFSQLFFSLLHLETKLRHMPHLSAVFAALRRPNRSLMQLDVVTRQQIVSPDKGA